MAKSREKVQQQGFWDPEVSTPTHDAIVLWTYRNAEALLPSILPEHHGVTWRPHEITSTTCTQQFLRDNPRPSPRIVAKSLEHVLTSYTGHRRDLARVVGYADLMLRLAFPRIEDAINDSLTDGLFGESEGGASTGHRRSPFGANPGEPLQPVYAPCVSWFTPPGFQILIEAKTAIPSLGELMRQINLYRTAFNGIVVVACPDDTHRAVLAEQNVRFLHCPSNPSTDPSP